VPGHNSRFAGPPAEVDNPPLEHRGEIDEPRFQPSLGEAHSQTEHLLLDERFDLGDRILDSIAMLNPLTMIRVRRRLDLIRPQHVQNLDLVHPTLDFVPEPADAPESLLQEGNERLSLGHGEGSDRHYSDRSTDTMGWSPPALWAETTIPRTSAELNPRFSISFSPAIVQPFGVVTWSISISG